MNGPEHYRDAEYLLNKLPAEDGGRNPDTGLTRAETLAAAQVHATLALAAASALPAAIMYYGDESHAVREWAGVVE